MVRQFQDLKDRSFSTPCLVIPTLNTVTVTDSTVEWRTARWIKSTPLRVAARMTQLMTQRWLLVAGEVTVLRVGSAEQKVHELFFNVQNPIRFDLWFRMSFG